MKNMLHRSLLMLLIMVGINVRTGHGAAVDSKIDTAAIFGDPAWNPFDVRSFRNWDAVSNAIRNTHTGLEKQQETLRYLLAGKNLTVLNYALSIAIRSPSSTFTAFFLELGANPSEKLLVDSTALRYQTPLELLAKVEERESMNKSMLATCGNIRVILEAGIREEESATRRASLRSKRQRLA